MVEVKWGSKVCEIISGGGSGIRVVMVQYAAVRL